jgi:hypothetical protein
VLIWALPAMKHRSEVDESQRLVSVLSQVEHRFGRSHPAVIE